MTRERALTILREHEAELKPKASRIYGSLAPWGRLNELSDIAAVARAAEQLRTDDVLRSAMERQFLVLSEAAVRLGQSTEELCPGSDWPGS